MSQFRKKYRKKITSILSGIWFLDPPKDISVDGWRIDNVIQYTDAVITIYFGIVVLAMLYFIIKYRARPGHKQYMIGRYQKHVGITLGMGLLVFLSIDVVIEGMSFKDLNEAFWNFPKGDDVVQVEVMPQQFAWNFRYAGNDGTFGTEDDLIPSQNQMHIPVNKPVVIQIAPYDVIHSFYLPNFRIKIDATPGMINTMWFQATETGQFEIACAELCGNSHYRMKGYLTVESEDDYNNWLKSLEEEGPEDEWEDEDDENPTRWGWAWKEAI